MHYVNRYYTANVLLYICNEGQAIINSPHTERCIYMKTYKFSARKHAHDIEFRRNRLKNDISAVENGEVKVDRQTYIKMLALLDELTELLEAVMYSSNGIVCELTGKQYGLAIETVCWADSQRC